MIMISDSQRKSQTGESQMKDKILIFGLDDRNVLNQMQRVLLIQKTGIRRIDRADYEQTIGALAGLPGYTRSEKRYEGGEFAAPMLVFCMGQQKMYGLLDGFRRAGVPSVDYKAMLTPTNSQWTPLQLYEELRKEHAAMHGNAGPFR